MASPDSEAAAVLTAAVLAQHRIPMTVEGAETVALFHKHVLYFLDLHLNDVTEGKPVPGAGTWPGRR